MPILPRSSPLPPISFCVPRVPQPQPLRRPLAQHLHLRLGPGQGRCWLRQAMCCRIAEAGPRGHTRRVQITHRWGVVARPAKQLWPGRWVRVAVTTHWLQAIALHYRPAMIFSLANASAFAVLPFSESM